MSLKNVSPCSLSESSSKNAKRTGNLDFTQGELMCGPCLSASATVTWCFPFDFDPFPRWRNRLGSWFRASLTFAEHRASAQKRFQVARTPIDPEAITAITKYFIRRFALESSIGMECTLFKLIQAEFTTSRIVKTGHEYMWIRYLQ